MKSEPLSADQKKMIMEVRHLSAELAGIIEAMRLGKREAVEECRVAKAGLDQMNVNLMEAIIK
jgi:hypothetical protein